jgi:hypothetical protein
MIPIDKVKIDSLRFYLPLSDVIVNEDHSHFLRKITTVNDDGEILNEERTLKHFDVEALVSVKYLVRSQFGNPLDIYISMNSKFLGKKYFTGINKDNIDMCLAFINAEGLVTITKEALLNAFCVDVDFCFDTYISAESGDIKSLVEICNDLTIPKKNMMAMPFRENNNRGYQWGHRNHVKEAYKTKQFLKYYGKAMELTNASVEFFEAYLKKPLEEVGNKYFECDRLLRVETTIKNKAHFKTYGCKIHTLQDLINLDLQSERVLEFFRRPMSTYMTGYKEIKHTKKMTVSQRTKYYMAYYMAKSKRMPIKDVISMASHAIHPKNIRSKREFKNELFNIISMQEVGKKTHLHNTDNWNTFISEIEVKNLIPQER